MSGTRAVSTKSRCELSSSFFSCKARRRRKFTPFWQTLAWFRPGRAKDLSAPLYIVTGQSTGCFDLDLAVKLIITMTYSFNKRLSSQEFHSFCGNRVLFTALIVIRRWSLLYQKNLVYNVTLYFWKFNFNIIFPLTLTSSKGVLPRSYILYLYPLCNYMFCYRVIF